jgi:hypothetical protein
MKEVAMAPGQYAGHRKPTAAQAEMIRGRIRAIASGAEPDITHGSNEYRAGFYTGPWAQNHPNAPIIGGNRFARNPKIAPGSFAPYDHPNAPQSPASTPGSADPRDKRSSNYGKVPFHDYHPGMSDAGSRTKVAVDTSEIDAALKKIDLLHQRMKSIPRGKAHVEFASNEGSLNRLNTRFSSGSGIAGVT